MPQSLGLFLRVVTRTDTKHKNIMSTKINLECRLYTLTATERAVSSPFIMTFLRAINFWSARVHNIIVHVYMQQYVGGAGPRNAYRVWSGDKTIGQA